MGLLSTVLILCLFAGVFYIIKKMFDRKGFADSSKV